MKRHTKKLLKLKKGGEDRPSKRSTKQKTNRRSRRVLKPSSPAAFPADKDFEFGDTFKPITEQTIYGLQDGKIVPIEYNKLDSDSANMEGVPTTELLKKLRAKTAKMIKKDKMKKLHIIYQPYTKNTDISPLTGYADEPRKEFIRNNKLSGPTKTIKSRPSSSSSQGSTDAKYEMLHGFTKY